MTTDDTTVTKDDLVDHWTVVLGEYWRQTDWEQFPDTKRRSESFAERLLSAEKAGDVHGATTKLAHGLGMSAPELPTENLRPLVNNDEKAMQVLRHERVWLVAKAKEAVENYFDSKNEGDDGADDPEPTTSELSEFIDNE